MHGCVSTDDGTRERELLDDQTVDGCGVLGQPANVDLDSGLPGHVPELADPVTDEVRHPHLSGETTPRREQCDKESAQYIWRVEDRGPPAVVKPRLTRLGVIERHVASIASADMLSQSVVPAVILVRA
jgi:hypothetical protein